jgi:hypothetical protein
VASGDQTLQGINGDIPHLLVLLLEQEDNTGGLGVEGAGNVEDGVLNNAVDDIVRDGALALEVVVGAARLDQVQKIGGSRVLEFGLSGAHCEGVERRQLDD